MIRPSQLQIAEQCGLAPVLAAQHPQGSVYAERGTKIHEEIATRKAMSREATAALAWLQERGWWDGVEHEVKVRLEDPESGELLTEGTADLLMEEAKLLHGGDWKSGRPENVPPPDENLQLLAYGTGAALARGADAFQVHLLFLDSDRVDVRSSRVYHAADWWPIIERIRAAASRPPVAVTGPHCGSCWQRLHCPAYTLPAHDGPSALAPFTSPGGLTADNAVQALVTVEAMDEVVALAREQLKAFVRANGPIEANGKAWGPSMTAGRRSGPSVKDLEAQGLGHLVKQGPPSERWDWRKAG